MFEIGDNIVYGTQGVCRLSDIAEREVGGKKAKYYVLKPVYQENNVILVPIENDTLTARMKRVMSAREIKELISAIPDEETIWIDDDDVRKNEYRSILSSGDRYAVVRVIKTLYAKQKERQSSGKRLHQNDEQLLKRAETLLYNELALALNIKPEQVVSFLTEQIEHEESKNT